MTDTEECQVDGNSVKYILKKLIGAGAFGQVFLARGITIKGEVDWAVKRISVHGTPEDASEYTEQFNLQMATKMEKILKLDHPNIIKHFAVYLRQPESLKESLTFVIVMEYANGWYKIKYELNVQFQDYR